MNSKNTAEKGPHREQSGENSVKKNGIRTDGRDPGARASALRYMIPGGLFALVLVIFALRTVMLGGTEAVLPGTVAAGNNLTTATVTVPARRGRIYDRVGTLLADSSYSYRLICDADRFPEPFVSPSHDIGDAHETIASETEANGTEMSKESGAADSDGDAMAGASSGVGTGYSAEPVAGSSGEAVTEADSDSSVPSPAVERLYETLAEYGCTGGYDSAAALAARLASGGTLVLSENTPMSMIAHVINDRPAGISVEKRVERVYYDGGSAAHLLGHTGKIQEGTLEYYSELGYPMDVSVGIDGAEAAFEQYLHGTDGKMRVTYDSEGNTVATEVISEAVPGSDVYLTVDIALQRTASQALAAKAAEVGSGGGAITAFDTETGEVLVCASYPTYTYEQYKSSYSSLSADESAPLFNRATSGRYAPGSVMKLATAIAALESGTITTDTLITDEGVYTYYEAQDFTPECWLYGRKGENHGTIGVRAAIMHSCNYFFFEAGRLTGIDSMNKWARSLGLGEPSGIELPESAPILAGPASRGGRGWGEGETLTAAIGQSDNLFTPTQLCSFISVIARGGERMSAHMLLRVCGEDGTVIYESEPATAGSAEISEATLDAVRGGMYDAARSGTVGSVFAHKSYEIAGKTGTAQISEEASNAVFAAYAPYDAPRIAAVCVIENGTDGFNAAYPAEALFTAYFGG